MRTTLVSNVLVVFTACVSAFATPSVYAIEELGPYGAVFNCIEPWEWQPIPRTHAFPDRVYQCADTRPGAAEADKAYDSAVSGHIDEAIQQFSSALIQSPAEPIWLLSRAKLYMKIGDEALAKADLRKAIRSTNVDSGRQFEIEQSLIRLGDYQFAEETIPIILQRFCAGPAVLPAQFQYLLACSQEQLGQSGLALDNYLIAANHFMIAGRPIPARLCVKRANAIASETKSNLPPYSISSLLPPRKGIERLKTMVAHLISHSDCFQSSIIQQETGATLTELRPGRFYERPPTTHFVGIGVSLKSIPGKEQLLEIGIEPRDCCLTLTDLEKILGSRKQVDAPEIERLSYLGRVAYEVPSGTLIIDSDNDGFRAIHTILVYRGGVRY